MKEVTDLTFDAAACDAEQFINQTTNSAQFKWAELHQKHNTVITMYTHI